MRRALRHLAGGAVLALLAACQPLPPDLARASAIAPAERWVRADLLGSDVAYLLYAPPLTKAQDGFFTTGQAGLSPAPQVGALRVSTPPGAAAAGRIMTAPLTQLPYLTWQWRSFPDLDQWLEPEADALPTQLLVGFRTEGRLPISGSDLPEFDHALSIVWARKPWEAGILNRRGPFGRYVAQAGAGDGQWWEQAVDLEGLHARLWPDLEAKATQVSFLAVAVRGTCTRTVVEVAEARLEP